MGRGKRKPDMEVVNRQIEAAQEEVMAAKRKYDEATEHLKELLKRRKELQTAELMEAVMKSKRSYEEILKYINSEPAEE